MESVDDAICTLDRAGRITGVYGRWLTRLGLAADRFLGCDVPGLLGPTVAAVYQPVHQHALAGETTTYEWDTDFLGPRLYVHTVASPLRDADDHIAGVVTVHRDITERVQAEQALRTAEANYRSFLESAVEGVFQSTPAGRHVMVNQALARIYGCDSPADLMASLMDLEHELYVEPGCREVLRRELAAHGEVRSFESQVRRKDGSIIWISENVRAVRDPTGEPQYYEGFVVDITERKRLEAQLAISDRMVSMGTLAAGVAHEINNPLAAVMANLDYALRELQPVRSTLPTLDEPLGALREALESADRVRQIVRDLKLFSRVEEEQRRVPLDVRLVLESAVRLAWNEIRHRAQVQRHYDEVLPVLANEGRLGQVFLNLLVNAAQAMSEGHTQENVIELRVTLDPQRRVAVEVRDSGTGMPPEVVARAFEPFFTTKPAGVGTGLGLPICHRIVNELHGEITIASEISRGTTVRVALPAALTAAHAAAPLLTPMPRRRARILVVDDEPQVVRAIARTLGLFHHVTTTTSGVEALAVLRAGASFDLVLCDIMMPEMSGPELYAELGRFRPWLAATMVFMTGGAFTAGANEFLDRVPNERIDKPLHVKALLQLVNRLLG